MLRTVLVDDEPNNLSSLREKLSQHCPQVRIEGCCGSAREGIETIDRLRPDLVFLDIEMPVMNGFVMLQQLQYRNFELIFITAYDHYAIRAIKFSALDYLVKPVEIEDLTEAVARAEQKINTVFTNRQLELLLENLPSGKKAFRRIAIPTAEGLQFVPVGDIAYLEASVNYTHIHLSPAKRYTVSRTLKEYEDILPPDTFLRIHHSFVVNKNHIDRYIRGDGGQVVMTDGVVLDVSKRRKAEFLHAMGY